MILSDEVESLISISVIDRLVFVYQNEQEKRGLIDNPLLASRVPT